jgi:hypothetical protein
MTRIACLLLPLLLSACAATGGPGAVSGAEAGTSASAAAAVAAAPRAVATFAPPSTPAGPELAAAAKALDAEVHALLAGGSVARRDGYVYATDVATLLLYAAQRKDAALYEALLPAAQQLIPQDAEDPYTSGFVLLRTKNGAQPDRSGSGEALWLARALWAGAAAFDRRADRELALAILDGYAKHAYVLQGVWLARSGFDFPTRSFANLSSVPDYQPDFLAEAERHAGRAPFRGFAERSYALLERAATPSGLLYPVIQPEVGATYPGAGLEIYAPNGLTPLEDTCLGAEGAVGGMPKLASALLDFSVKSAGKGARLRAFYSVDDGAASGEAPLSAAGTACLARLASALNHAEALAALDGRLTAELAAAAKSRSTLSSAGPLLLAAQARGAF